MKNILFALILCLAGFNYLFAQPGINDPGFNVADDCTFGSGESFDKKVMATALQTDGKIVTGGDFTIYNGKIRNRIARLNADGTLDQSFNPGTGCNGEFFSYTPTYVRALAVQKDGKILAGGNFLTYNGISRKALVRINADGSIDKSFNVGNGFDAPVFSIALQPDGKILVGGNFTMYNGVSRVRIARLHANGTLDTSFNPGSGFNQWVSAMVVQSNGRILVGGFFSTYNGNTSLRMARLLGNGTFDASFSTGTNGFQSEVTSILKQADGKIIAAGHFTNYKGTLRVRIARLDTSGNLDLTFNAGSGFNAGVYATSLQPDGKIIVGGAFTNYNLQTYHRICRLNSNGTIDTSFRTGKPYIIGEIVYTTLLQPDGKVVIGGELQNHQEINALNHIARLNANGTFETSFNHGTGFQAAEVSTFYVQPDNKILVGGIFYSFNGVAGSSLAKLNPDGSLDTSFHIGTVFNADIRSISGQADGKFIIAGGFTKYDEKTSWCIARLHNNGALDTTFRTGTGFNALVYATAIQNDGKVLAAGHFTKYKDTAVNRIIRLNPDGSIDTTFAVGTGFDDLVFSLLIQPDGKIVVGGRFTKYKNTSYSCLIRLLANGDIDTTFNMGTGIKTGFPSSGIPFVRSIVMQNDGKIIAVGNFMSYDGNSRNGMVRINQNGSVDSGFSIGPGFDKIVYRAIVQSDGKIIAAGTFTTFRSVSRNGIVRIQSNGMLDTAFKPGTGFNRYTEALAFHKGERILVGGDFTEYDGNCRTRIARLFNCEKLRKDVHTACNSFNWIDGKTYTSSTRHAYHEITGGASNGCDSFRLLDLTIKKSSGSTHTITACSSYKWIDGNTYTASNDTATHTYAGGAANGCDSVVTLKLTIHYPKTGIHAVTACKSYKWIDGNTYTSSNSTAKYTYAGGASNGCDSVVTLSLALLTVNKTVTKTLDILTSNAIDADYQWIDCDNGHKPIAGATGRIFSPDTTGNYAVIVKKDGCTDTSACIFVEVESSGLSTPAPCDVAVYPSPSGGVVYIEMGTYCEARAVKITDHLGRLVRSVPVNDNTRMELEMHDLKGIFFIEVIKPSGTSSRHKIILN